MKLRMLIVMFAVMMTLLVPLSAGQIATFVPLPADLQGELNGVPYRIRVPQNWNGTLLVYAHGYGDSVKPPLLAPLAADVETLLARGFALAASRFAGSGWNCKEGMQNTVALTAAFRGMVGRPQRTIMWGKSMGGLMTLGLIEKFPGHYDGAVALCPPAAGTPRRFDQALDVALAYSVAFEWKPEWGTEGDIRDDLNFVTEVMPYIQPVDTPEQFARWEFIRLVNRAPGDSYYMGTNRLMTLYFAIGVRAELEGRAGGPIAENIGREYTLTSDEISYLGGLGLDAKVLLAEMNAMTTFMSDPNARNYVEHYVNPSGRITRPVLTLHTKGDALATPNHESAYRATVEQHGNGDLLMQQFTKGLAHCTFTSAQDIAGIDAMMYWLDTGNRPSPSFFPEALGFDPIFFPLPWPW
jgi:pimeloyl-ACP methyl ester carboxylesterase